ncbi:MAG: rod shape-determining protein MreD [Bacteroidetes bacterium]|nr:rod shape-determining protein MreD [Bacteroidota bacterium]
MNTSVRNILRFILIISLQVLILNKINLRWWSQPNGFPVFVPYVYPLFILLLPFEAPVWLLLVIGFATGITMDSFSNTAGLHAFATVLIAYLRTNVLNALMPKNLSEYPNQTPSVKNMGWVPFLVYSSFLILVHHIAYFTIEVWSLANIGYLLLKIFASAITSILFIIVYVLLFTRQNTYRG